MKRKTILCLALAALLLLSCLTGCQPADDPASGSAQQEKPVPAVPLSAVTEARALGFSTISWSNI